MFKLFRYQPPEIHYVNCSATDIIVEVLVRRGEKFYRWADSSVRQADDRALSAFSWVKRSIAIQNNTGFVCMIERKRSVRERVFKGDESLRRADPENQMPMVKVVSAQVTKIPTHIHLGDMLRGKLAERIGCENEFVPRFSVSLGSKRLPIEARTHRKSEKQSEYESSQVHRLLSPANGLLGTLY